MDERDLTARLQAVKIVCFDAAGTLLFPEPSVGAIYREVMLSHGLDLPAEELQNAFVSEFKSVPKDRSITNGEARERSYWQTVVQRTLARLGSDARDFDTLFDDLWNAFAEGKRWRCYPEDLETLRRLRSRGYRLGLLTNWDNRVRQVVQEKELAPFFEEVLISSEVGYEKPDPRIFAAAERRFGAPHSEFLHIGDDEEKDVAGPVGAGWSAIRLGCEGRAASAQFSIERLSQLLDILLRGRD